MTFLVHLEELVDKSLELDKSGRIGRRHVLRDDVEWHDPVQLVEEQVDGLLDAEGLTCLEVEFDGVAGLAVPLELFCSLLVAVIRL